MPKTVGYTATGQYHADGYEIRRVQGLLGHKDIRTTMICTHVLGRGVRALRSPAEALPYRPDER